MFSVLAEGARAVSGDRLCVLLAGVRADGQGGGADALSRILVHLGVDQAGEVGGFTDRLQALNRDILASARLEECSIEPLHAGWYLSLRHEEFHRRAVDLVNSTFASSSLFVLNDGATGRLVPFWQNVLKACEVEAVVLDFYEDPASFASRFSQSVGVDEQVAGTVWLARAIESEYASRGGVRAHLTEDALLDDWESALSRLSKNLGVVWPAWSSRVRKAIVGELGHGDRSAAGPARRKAPQADQAGRWVQAVHDVLWRWSHEGEDDRGRTQMDELRAQFEEARESLVPAFMALAEMGQELRLKKQVADELLGQLSELQRKSNAGQATAPAGELATIRTAHAESAGNESEGQRGQRVTQSQANSGASEKVEARWLEVFRSRLHAAEILAEQNGVFQTAIQRLTAEIDELKTRLKEAQAEVERLRLGEIVQKADIAAARSEISHLNKSQKDLAEAQKRVSELRKEASFREATIEELQNALLASAAAGTAHRARKINLSPKSLLQYLKPKARKKMRRHDRLRQLVLASGLFDVRFYVSRYPDVVAAGADPLDHFINFGGTEGRHPSLSFNSKWYLSEYPDIRSSGLNPLVHYLEHGRDEGRRRRSLTNAGVIAAELAEASAAPTSESHSALTQATNPPLGLKAVASELEATWLPRIGGWKALLSSDKARRSPAVPLEELACQVDAPAVAVADKVVALVASDTPSAALDRIVLFAAMRAGMAAPVTVAGERAADITPHALLAEPGCGLGLLADGWCDGESGLTLRLSNGFSGVARVFQVDGEGLLQCVAETVLGGGEGDCVAVRLVDPLAPLLVGLAKRDGTLVDSAVVPFPSLLRGGLHYGELAVLETAPGSMATLAEYSRTLALEWLGWDQGPDRHAISRIEIDMRGASGTEPIFRPAVLSSIARHFGITVCARDGSYEPERGQLVSMLEAAGLASAGRGDPTGSLVIPSDAIPSIYGLVARRMPHNRSFSRFAMVDAATGRPHADVTLPFDEGLARFQHAEMPAHAPHVVSLDSQEPGGGGPVFPLAVRHYNKLAWQADPLMPVSPDRDMPMEPDLAIEAAITVVIDVGQDPERLANCLAALENQIGAERLDVILAGWPDGAPLPSCEIPLRSIDLRGSTLSGRLNAAARMSEAGRIMFLAPSVLLSDPRATATLSRMVDRPGTASVACALVTEAHDDGEARVHSAGYFPTRVSLHGEPVFDFDQLDVARIMPAATFPVVANHAKCVLYNAETFRKLGGFDAQRFPMAMHDLDFGFRALAAGYTNLCTTLIRAAVEDAAPSVDFPDPLAHRSVRPEDWQSLLERVTVVRELRR